MCDEGYVILCELKAKNRIFRKACNQVILLNHKIEAAKVRYDRARSVRRLAFRYSYRMKLTGLEGVRNLIYEYACVKCDEIEALQAKLLEVTGDVYDFVESEASDMEDEESDQEC